MKHTVPHRQPTARQNMHTWRTVLQLYAAWWLIKNQTEKAFASVSPCNGFAASRPSWKVLSKFLVSPLGQKSSESSHASNAIVFTAAALLPAVTGNAGLTHQGLHLQLLHRVWVALCESAGNRGEQEQKNVGLHCRVPEKSCHSLTSVRAAPANRDAERRAPATRSRRPKWLSRAE